MSEEKLELHADYTDREKAKQAKKEKKSLAAKKASETRKRKKEQKQKEEDAVFWKRQDEKGYKNLFGENNNKTDKKEDMEYQILDAILEAHEAEKIAQDYRLSSEEEGAALWFNEIYYDSTWHMDKMPKYKKFIKEIEGGNLYYDYGANYYFLVQRNNKNESKNMSKKNTIRLTESELKNVITESVKNIISELDWKTYQNARRKANEKGEYDRALKFGNAAQKEFNKAYGEEGVSGDIFLNRVSAESDDYPSHTLMRMYNYDEEGNYSNPYNYDSTKAFGIMDKYDKNGRYKRVKNPSLKRFFNNSEREKAYKDASKEMDDYVMGNYDYTQGNGWHLKDNK